MFDLQKLVRKNIRQVTAYSSARDEFNSAARIFLDANENAYGAPIEGDYHRYPDPVQKHFKVRLAEMKGLHQKQIFAGNGSDESIDLLFRAFCRPGVDNVMILPPTYGMYAVSAGINDVDVRAVPLNPDFSLDPERVLEGVSESTKMIFICSPNNPTGNIIEQEAIEQIVAGFTGLVVVDEAYIDFARTESLTTRLKEFPNLVVLQTLSKAWGLAGLRMGMACASPEIIAILNKIKPPYNVSTITQKLALQALDNVQCKNENVERLIQERQRISEQLRSFSGIEKVYPSQANFILFKVKNAMKIYQYLLEQGIVVRDRSSMAGCEDCLRLTVGTTRENDVVLHALKEKLS